MQNPKAPPLDLFAGKGEMADLLRSTDWEKTALGPVQDWDESLKTALRIIMHSGYPMFIWWGKDLTMFHNDAYLPVLGKKHPEALGKSARDVWSEIWDDVGGLVEQVMKGEHIYAHDLLLYLGRKGFAEETYWTFSYSPVLLNNGEVGGLFCACNEETRKILQQRRLQTLMDISGIHSQHKKVDRLLHRTLQILEENKRDIPFAAIYLLDEKTQEARLQHSYGVSAEAEIFEKRIPLNQPSDLGWDFTTINAGANMELRKDLRSRFGENWQESNMKVDTAALLSIPKSGEEEVEGILICGISPCLEFNSEYSEFLKLIATNIAKAKTEIRSREIIQQRAEALAEADKAKSVALDNLKQGQERLYSMIMQAPIAMAILRDENFVFEIANDSYLEVVGKTAEEIMHKPVLKAIPELRDQPIMDVLHQVYTTGETFKAEDYPIQLYRNNTWESVYFTFVYEPMHDLQGNVNGIMLVAIDQTAQVEARHLLEEREQYFRNMANDVPVMIWMLNEEGGCTYLNSQWLKYTGQHYEEGLGRGWLKAVHPQDREESEAIVDEAIRNQTYFEVVYRLRDAGGDYFWHLDAGQPRFDNTGNFEGFTGAVVKIHERKIAEDALKQSENELRSAISATNLGTWIYYPATGELNWSVRSRELFGLSPDDHLDYQVFLERLHPDDRARTNLAVEQALDPQLRKSYSIEYRSVDTDTAKTRWLRASGQPFFNDNDQPEVFIGTLLDITERKALEKQKEDFLAIASHELKTPVTSIKGYVQMIEEDFRNKGELEAADHLRKVDKQVDKLIMLINDLLDANKVESDELQLNKSLFDFDSLLDEVVYSMQYAATGHKLVYTGKTGKFIYGDRNRIEQVLVNLVSNAIKFSPDASEVHISCGVDKTDAWVKVRDFGVGIKPDNLQNIFDRFYRDTTSGLWSNGLGLGLFISADIIKRHQGSIQVESELGSGSVFQINLPFQKSDYE